MDFALDVARGIYVFHALVILTLCFVFVLRRFVWRCRRNKRGFYPTYASAGNALQSLQTMVQPRVEYVLSEKFDDESDDDDEGDDNEKVAKPFRRQLRKIRLGESIQTLTVIAPRHRTSYPLDEEEEIQ
jgi:hypothetical protein